MVGMEAGAADDENQLGETSQAVRNPIKAGEICTETGDYREGLRGCTDPRGQASLRR